MIVTGVKVIGWFVTTGIYTLCVEVGTPSVQFDAVAQSESVVPVQVFG